MSDKSMFRFSGCTRSGFFEFRFLLLWEDTVLLHRVVMKTKSPNLGNSLALRQYTVSACSKQRLSLFSIPVHSVSMHPASSTGKLKAMFYF